MKVLITGNLGYVGAGLVEEFRFHLPQSVLMGYDIAYFANYLTTANVLVPEHRLDVQYYGDVRKFPEEILAGVDVVVSLAAISNDPIGNRYEQATWEINHKANVDIAKQAKAQGVKRFIFASSCSVYGSASSHPRVESDSLAPLTAYAKSKVQSEIDLAPLADDGFMVTCLRFATACGMSERLRLDLVLNDFVAGAISNGEIDILSDGSPWRPLINVKDMARAIRWAATRSVNEGGSFLVMNTGTSEWNYQIKTLAMHVKEMLPNTKVSINSNAEPDKRSYQVNFDLYKTLAPQHQPLYNIQTTVEGLVLGLKAMNFTDSNFRQSPLMRLNVIQALRKKGLLNEDLSVKASQI